MMKARLPLSLKKNRIRPVRIAGYDFCGRAWRLTCQENEMWNECGTPTDKYWEGVLRQGTNSGKRSFAETEVDLACSSTKWQSLHLQRKGRLDEMRKWGAKNGRKKGRAHRPAADVDRLMMMRMMTVQWKQHGLRFVAKSSYRVPKPWDSLQCAALRFN